MQARRITVLALLAGLTLAGCGEDEPEPKVEPPASSTAIPSPTAPVEPTLPPEAEGTSKAAAEAFVRHYYAMVNYSQAAADTSALRALAHGSCDACDGGADALDSVFAKGGVIEGGQYTITDAKTGRLSGAPLYETRVEATLESTDQVITGTGTKSDGPNSGGRSTVIFRVLRQDDAWIVMEWSVA